MPYSRQVTQTTHRASAHSPELLLCERECGSSSRPGPGPSGGGVLGPLWVQSSLRQDRGLEVSESGHSELRGHDPVGPVS